MKNGKRFNAGRFHAGRFSGNDGGTSSVSFLVSVSGLTNNPEYGQTAQVGVPLVASAFGFSGPAPASISWQWRNRSGDIVGASTATYTPVPGDDLETIYPVAIPSDNYPAKSGATHTVRFAPPTSAKILSNVSYIEGSGSKTTPTANGFSGSNLTFSVASGVAGITIDTDTGLVTIPTHYGLQSGPVVITAANSGGSASASFELFITDIAFELVVGGLTGGVAQIGTAVSANISWLLPETTVDSLRWYSDGVAIPGANSSVYTVDAAIDGSVLSCSVTTAEYGTVTSVAHRVLFPAPSAAGGLPDVSFGTGSGDRTVDTSTDFTGDGIEYSVDTAIAGVTIDPLSGVVTIPTSAIAAGIITITGSNSGGTDSSAFGVIVSAATSELTFGADSLPGLGGIETNATAITGGTAATNYDIIGSGGTRRIVIATGQTATAGTLELDGGMPVPVTVEADVIDVWGKDPTLGRYALHQDLNEIDQVVNTLGGAAMMGKTIKARPGARLGHLSFSIETMGSDLDGLLTLTSRDADNPGRVSSIYAYGLGARCDLTFHKLVFPVREGYDTCRPRIINYVGKTADFTVGSLLRTAPDGLTTPRGGTIGVLNDNGDGTGTIRLSRHFGRVVAAGQTIVDDQGGSATVSSQEAGGVTQAISIDLCGKVAFTGNLITGNHNHTRYADRDYKALLTYTGLSAVPGIGDYVRLDRDMAYRNTILEVNDNGDGTGTFLLSDQSPIPGGAALFLQGNTFTVHRPVGTQIAEGACAEDTVPVMGWQEYTMIYQDVINAANLDEFIATGNTILNAGRTFKTDCPNAIIGNEIGRFMGDVFNPTYSSSPYSPPPWEFSSNVVYDAMSAGDDFGNPHVDAVQQGQWPLGPWKQVCNDNVLFQTATARSVFSGLYLGVTQTFIVEMSSIGTAFQVAEWVNGETSGGRYLIEDILTSPDRLVFRQFDFNLGFIPLIDGETIIGEISGLGVVSLPTQMEPANYQDLTVCNNIVMTAGTNVSVDNIKGSTIAGNIAVQAGSPVSGLPGVDRFPALVSCGSTGDGGGNRFRLNVGEHLPHGPTTIRDRNVDIGDTSDCADYPQYFNGDWNVPVLNKDDLLARLIPKPTGTNAIMADGTTWTPGDAGCVDSNGNHTPWNPAHLTPIAPTLISAPVVSPVYGTVGTVFSATDAVYVCEDSFTVEHQWKLDGVDIPGATNATFNSTGQSAGILERVDTAISAGGTNVSKSLGASLASVGTYSAHAVDLNGVSLRNNDLSPATSGNSQSAVLCMWVKFAGSVSSGEILTLRTRTNSSRVFIETLATGALHIGFLSAAGTFIGELTSPAATVTTDTWHHIAVDFNTVSGNERLSLYVDGVSVGSPNLLVTDGIIGAASKSWLNVYGDNRHFADVYINVEQGLDLSIGTNMTRFRDGGGNPVYLGADGTTPTGSPPFQVFQFLPAETWRINKASIGTNDLEVGSGAVVIARERPTGSVTVPAAFSPDQWSAATGSGASEIDLDITALPSDGGSQITGLQYSVDAGATWAALSGAATGNRTVDRHSSAALGKLTGSQSYDVQLRAVNTSGNGASSDTKRVRAGTSASAGYTAQGIDISTSSLKEDPMPISNAAGQTQALWSMWVYAPANWTTYDSWVSYWQGNSARVVIQPVSAGRIQATINGNDGTNICNLVTAPGSAMQADIWFHLAVTYDSTPGGTGFRIFLDGAEATYQVNAQPFPNVTLPDEANRFFLNLYGANQPFYIADFYELWGGTLDLSDPASMEKFRDAAGKPVWLGADGALPTGTLPSRFLSGGSADWHVDDSSGRVLVVTGSGLSNAPNNP